LIGLAALGPAACSPPPAGTVYVHAEEPLGPESGSVLSSEVCYVSGKIGTPGETFAAEASSALDALEQELARAGLRLSELVQVTVYLTDLADHETFNAVYAARVGEPRPARAVVEVSALPGGARVQIQAVARRH
jgi:2-iminobutanoate/2-iminopropanoate deaminase